MAIIDLGATASKFDPLETRVPADGMKQTARFILLGEAPGGVEMAQRKPFVGPAGGQLDRLLSAASLPRYSCYITNCCKTQLPDNNTATLWTKNGWEHEKLEELRIKLWEELENCPAKIIIGFGETPLWMLKHEASITKHRGSIYKIRDKIFIPTFHPARSLPYADPVCFWIIYQDLLKAIRIEQDGYAAWEPTVHLEPSFSQAMEFLAEIKQLTTFDIETVAANKAAKQVSCIGFTLDSHKEVMCIPFKGPHGDVYPEQQELMLWQQISKVLGSTEIKKAAQNGMFDLAFLLRVMQIKTRNFWFDTMEAQHICWTDLPKGLDFLVSVYTDHPYYKDDGKTWRDEGDFNKFWLYNARDAAYTHECIAPLQEELTSINAWPTFELSMRLHDALIEMQWRGILMDKTGMFACRDRLASDVVSAQQKLNQLAGRELNTNSPKQVAQYFYIDKNIPPYKNGGKITTDDDAMKRLARKGYEEAKLIQSIRSLRKLIGTYFVEQNLDPDGRLRCEFKFGTDTGRLSSAGTLFGTGTNLQNQPPIMKQFFLADPGRIFIEVDLSQAEARDVAYESQDQNMMLGFESGVDVHKFNASNIFGVPIAEVTKEQRQMGKKIVHASNYSMSYKKMALELELPEKEADRLLKIYHSRYPGLKQWHASIRAKLFATRMLHTLYGRPKRFLGMLNDDTFRAAYAYSPQGTVGEALNRVIDKLQHDSRFDNVWMHVQVHDSLLVSVEDSWPEVLRVCMLLNELATVELFANGRKFIIPCDFKIGYKWSGYEIKDHNVLAKAACRQGSESLASPGCFRL